MSKIVIFSGAGLSVGSGLPTYRGKDGLWRNRTLMELATPEAWLERRELVLEFYNERRRRLGEVRPTPAHRAIARLEERHEVVVVTQNVDDLHERAGSTRVFHLHGELRKVRSEIDAGFIRDIGTAEIALGDCCPRGGQLRPHIVWFGEEVMAMEESIEAVTAADRILVVGTSLSVYPAAMIPQMMRVGAEGVVVDPEVERLNLEGFEHIQATAEAGVPDLVERWMKD